MGKVTSYFLSGAFAIVAIILIFQLKPNRVSAQQASTPTLKHISPETITAGGRPFTIMLTGSGFVAGANVLFDGAPLPNPRVLGKKGTGLLADVSALQVAQVRTHSVQGVNPDGGATQVATLNVVQKDPDLNIRLVGTVAEENIQSDLLLDVFGGDFDSSSTGVVWGFDSPTTALVNATELTFVITQDLLTVPAQIPVMVRNKGNRLSNYEIFFVVPRPIKIEFIDPDTIDVGTDDFTLDVVGPDFTPDAVIVVNGQTLHTTAVKPTKLEATVPGAFRSAPGELVVRVEERGIQSQDQTLIVSPTTGPFIFSLAPSKLPQGQKRATISASGANFTGKTTATIDGVPHDIRAVTHKGLVIVLGSDFLATTGSHVLQLMDDKGNASNTVPFQVVQDVNVTTLSGFPRGGFTTGCVGASLAVYRGPRRLALGPDGLLYITDQINHAIRSLNPATGEVCTVAGTGLAGYVNSNNPRNWAPVFSNPNGLAVAADGTIYVSDNGNSVIRRITRASGGAVTVDTFVGTTMPVPDRARQDKINSTEVGLAGFRDGPALDSLLEQPDDIVIAADGTIYVSDAANSAIRRIRQVAGRTVLDTLAGSGIPGFIDGSAESARFNTPTGIALSRDGQFLLVADFGNDRIRRVNLSTGKVDTLAGSGNAGSADGPPAEASFDGPLALAVDANGAVFVTDFNSGTIRIVDTSGTVNTVAGGGRQRLTDGPGRVARFSSPKGLALDIVGRVLYVADFGNNVIRRVAIP